MGIIRKASFMSAFAISAFGPHFRISAATSSKVSKVTLELCLGISELTEGRDVSAEKDKSWISRKALGYLLGTTPRGLHTIFFKGGLRNGPFMRPSEISDDSLLWTNIL